MSSNKILVSTPKFTFKKKGISKSKAVNRVSSIKKAFSGIKDKSPIPERKDDLKVELGLEAFTVGAVDMAEAKVLTRAVVKESYEVDVEDTPEDREIYQRELENVEDPQIAKMARAIVEYNFSYDKTKVIDPFFRDYHQAQNYHLPWLIPIVADRKLVYKRKYLKLPDSSGDRVVVDPTAQLVEVADYRKNFKQLVGRELVGYSQNLVDLLNNYPHLPPPNSRNHSGRQVFRLKMGLEGKQKGGSSGGLGVEDVELRGSYPDWTANRVIEKMGKKMSIAEVISETKVIGEPLHVVGFAKVSWPRDRKWKKGDRGGVEFRLIGDVKRAGDISYFQEEIKDILREFILTPDQVIDWMETTGVTDLRVFDRALKQFGHSLANLSNSARNKISKIILKNIDNYQLESYQVRLILEYPELERELVESPILGVKLLESPVIKSNYNIDVKKMTQLTDRYYHLVTGRLDRGDLWRAVVRRDVIGVGGKAELEKGVVKAEKALEIKREFTQLKERSRVSYHNYWAGIKTDGSLLERANNPLDNILVEGQDRWDWIAWNHYFKKARLGTNGKFYYFRGRMLGCQHEYDRLYKKFEDPSDTYPMGKSYTQIVPNNGVVCSYDGAFLIEEDMMIDQGFDVDGQKIKLHTALTSREYPEILDESVMAQFERKRSPIHQFGAKIIDRWIMLNKVSFEPIKVRQMKFLVLKQFGEMVGDDFFGVGLEQNPNQVMEIKTYYSQVANWLVENHGLKEDSVKKVHRYFIGKVVEPISAIMSIYQLAMGRIAALLVCLNWYLITRFDIGYVNPKLILEPFTPEQVMSIFLELNIPKKAVLMDLGKFYGRFKADFESQYRLIHPKISAMKLERLIETEFNQLAKIYLYVPNLVGNIFNGTRSFDFEMGRLVDSFISGTTGLRKEMVVDGSGRNEFNSSIAYLNDNYMRFWGKLAEKVGPKLESYRKQFRSINMVLENRLLGEVSPDIRPLYDRFVAQRKYQIGLKLSELYLELVNSQIYEIRDSNRIVSSGEPVIQSYQQLLERKFYFLDKLNCDDWTEFEDLNMVGLSGETELLNNILNLKTKLSEYSLIPEQYVSRAYFSMVPDYRSEDEVIYPTPFDPAVGSELGKIEKLGRRGNGNKKGEKGEMGEMGNPLDKPSGALKDFIEGLKKSGVNIKLDFMPEVGNIMMMMGQVGYLGELERQLLHRNMIVSGQSKPTATCQTAVEPDQKAFMKDFVEFYSPIFKDRSTKWQIRGLYKYLMGYLRHHIELMSRLEEADELLDHSMNRYIGLAERNTEFYEAFENFEVSLSNSIVEAMVNRSIESGDSEQHELVINLLKMVFVEDVSRHYRKVKIRSGQRGRKRNQGEDSLLDTFTEFLKILFEEINLSEGAMNTPLDHREINLQFNFFSMLERRKAIKDLTPMEREIFMKRLALPDEVVVGDDEEGGEEGERDEGEEGGARMELGMEFEEMDTENDVDDIDQD